MIFVITIFSVLVFSMVSGGFWVKKKNKGNKKIFKLIFGLNLILLLGITILCANFLIPEAMAAAAGGEAGNSGSLGYLAAALAVGLSSIGAGIAVGITGSSALGAISEDNEIFGQTLIYVGLAEGIAIYGLVISIMILGRL